GLRAFRGVGRCRRGGSAAPGLRAPGRPARRRPHREPRADRRRHRRPQAVVARLNRMLAALRYAWAAPATLAGLLVALPAFAAGARARVIDGVIEVTGGRVERMVAALPR